MPALWAPKPPGRIDRAIGQHPQIADRAGPVGDGDRQIFQHPPAVMAGAVRFVGAKAAGKP
jgi:hypothetical protein